MNCNTFTTAKIISDSMVCNHGNDPKRKELRFVVLGRFCDSQTMEVITARMMLLNKDVAKVSSALLKYTKIQMTYEIKLDNFFGVEIKILKLIARRGVKESKSNYYLKNTLDRNLINQIR